ncbi:MAG: ABC transporter substrate-binding protein [Thermodesulfobacteriota bacterium]
MRQQSIIVVGLLTVAMILAAPVYQVKAQADEAETETSPEKILKKNIEEVIEILEDPEMEKQRKEKEISGVVDPIFDYKLMAMLSLGRKNWSRLSSDQQQVFTKRFVERLKASYFDKISLYSKDLETKMTYKPAQTKGSKVHVPVEVDAKDETVDLIYKFYEAEAGWQIYDVEINDVSIIQSYRSQFNQVLSGGTVEDLLEELKKPGKLEPES